MFYLCPSFFLWSILSSNSTPPMMDRSILCHKDLTKITFNIVTGLVMFILTHIRVYTENVLYSQYCEYVCLSNSELSVFNLIVTHTRARTHIQTHVYIYIYIYIYTHTHTHVLLLCHYVIREDSRYLGNIFVEKINISVTDISSEVVCVCVCVCVYTSTSINGHRQVYLHRSYLQ